MIRFAWGWLKALPARVAEFWMDVWRTAAIEAQRSDPTLRRGTQPSRRGVR